MLIYVITVLDLMIAILIICTVTRGCTNESRCNSFSILSHKINVNEKQNRKIHSNDSDNSRKTLANEMYIRVKRVRKWWSVLKLSRTGMNIERNRINHVMHWFMNGNPCF